MKINFFTTKNNWIKDEFANIKNEINNINNRLNLLDNKMNNLENKMETKFMILDHDLNEIKIILKSIIKNKV